MVLVVLLMLVGQTPVVPTPRDSATAESPRGTAIVRGRVTDAETGLPLARVRVALYAPRTRTQLDTKTDTDGAFDFRRVPAGGYTLTADPTGSRTTYLAGTYLVGQGPGRTSVISVKDGDVLEKADIALQRSYVISGRVLDEDGDPVADARVDAERVGGEAVGGLSSRSRTTDDRGSFRLWGFAPGSYRVCATPLSFSIERQGSEGLMRTCHPSSAELDSEPVVLTNTDSPEIEIRLKRTRLFRISGVILDASGAVTPRANLSFGTVERSGSSARSSQNEGGTFTFTGLAPGEYFVRAELGSPFNLDDQERQLGYTPVTIQSSDVDGVVVAMVPPAMVRGHLVFEGGGPPPFKSLSVRASPETGNMAMRSGPTLPAAPVTAAYSFEVRGLFGPHTLLVEGARGWVIKSMRYRNEERAHVPTDFRTNANAASVEIVLTNRTAKLLVRVLDEKGQPAQDALILLFPADVRQWNTANLVRFGSMRNGVAEFIDVRPADYFVVAVNPSARVSPGDRRALEELSKNAERISLFENDQRTLDVVFRKPQ